MEGVEVVQVNEETHKQKEVAAHKIWEDRGCIPDDPMTLENWLTAEGVLASGISDVKLEETPIPES